MRRSSWVLASGFVLVACGQQATNNVYVDLDRVQRVSLQDFRVDLTAKDAPLNIPAMPGLSVPARAAQKARVHPSAQPGVAEKIFSDSRERALSELITQLRKVYESELTDFIETESRKADEGRQAAEKRYTDAVRTEFEAYALARAPLVARLAYLVGFPDPDPLSNAKAANAARQRRLAEAQTIRDNLSKLQAGFEQNMAVIISTRGSTLKKSFADLQARINDMRAEADRRAELQAQSEVSKMAVTISDPMNKVEIPTIPGRAAVNVPGRAATHTAPPPKMPTSDQVSPAQAKKEVQAELEIWAGINGYRVGGANSGQDKTQEFIDWRKSHHPGP